METIKNSIISNKDNIEEKTLIEVKNLVKKFGNLIAVDGISFKIRNQEILGLLGPNGAGKTTTIRLITGVFPLENKDTIKVLGKDIKDSTEYKKNFGIVPEVSNAFLDFTVWQNISFSGELYGMSKKEIEMRGNELLEIYDLKHKKYSITKSLSKGLKQRLNFCMALIHDPKIIILDEPTTGLDPISVKILREQILYLKEMGKTILITTHDMKEAEKICDRVLIMFKGKIIANEVPSNLKIKYGNKSEISFQLNIDKSENLAFKNKNNIRKNANATEKNVEENFGDHVKDKNERGVIKAGDFIKGVKRDLTKDQKIINFLAELKKNFRIKKQKGKYLFVSNAVLKDMALLYELSQKYNISIENLKVKEPTLEDAFIKLIEEQEVINQNTLNTLTSNGGT